MRGGRPRGGDHRAEAGARLSSPRVGPGGLRVARVCRLALGGFDLAGGVAQLLGLPRLVFMPRGGHRAGAAADRAVAIAMALVEAQGVVEHVGEVARAGGDRAGGGADLRGGRAEVLGGLGERFLRRRGGGRQLAQMRRSCLTRSAGEPARSARAARPVFARCWATAWARSFRAARGWRAACRDRLRLCRLARDVRALQDRFAYTSASRRGSQTASRRLDGPRPASSPARGRKGRR